MSPTDDSSPFEIAFGAVLEALVPGATVHGVLGAWPVDVVSVRWFGREGILLHYREPNGNLGSTVLRRQDEARLSIASGGRDHAFDGDGAAWRLAAEALRLRYAALFDPLLAVAGSDLQPLPHQIKAVYGELLPRTPLRFLLADDPGAGKTIMAGLYIKELILRGDLERCLIVAPGGLAQQWMDELFDKFGLSFEVLTNSLVESTVAGSVFDHHPLLIARMDHLSRRTDLLELLDRSDWDLVVVDEAHRMSAHYFGPELKATKRYQLGQLLGRVTRHLLLMTATPHAGKQEDFQLFMALLDGDRFEGRFRDGVHSITPEDLMRRMVKEELMTMEGKPLFPDRFAYTVPYDLSEAEAQLYEVVTQYVREEMNRADRLRTEGQGRRGNTVGFALTVLQRRLASSPEAILRSLERRKARLERRRRELSMQGVSEGTVQQRLDELLGRTLDDIDIDADDDLEELTAAEREEVEEDIVDAATAARTLAELDKEIDALGDLVTIATRVRHLGTDRKWSELRDILDRHELTHDAEGNLRKTIVFTEHRDTLNYLVEQIRSYLGREDVVVSIHGGDTRERRTAAQALFTADNDTRILVATDAAGEGLNLQRAHLMVNYDLPWNPNRIEQRFGRIHRIGQTEVCHLWNLVARNTREGEVFVRLLEKIEEQRAAYGGKVFDVLGDAFDNEPLRSLLLEAIRYGDQPEVRAKLDQVIDASVGEGLDVLMAERALHRDVLSEADVEKIRQRFEEARARRLQPHFIEAFFKAAFTALGGRISIRERGRYEITHVPPAIRDRDRAIGVAAPVLTKYERVTFNRERMRKVGSPPAQLLAPGHPLLDAVVDLTIEQHRSQLKRGAILVDRLDAGETPRLLVPVVEEIADGHEKQHVISKRFDFVEIDQSGAVHGAGPAPYLDYEPTADEAERDAVAPILRDPWLSSGAQEVAVDWVLNHSLVVHEREIRDQVTDRVARERREVQRRLLGEINYWDARHAALLDDEAAGKRLKIRPETARRRARALEDRLQSRLEQLRRDEHLTVREPLIDGIALVVPQGLVDRLMGRREGPVATFAKETAFVERRAVEAVLATERALGRAPTELPHNNPGYDIRSTFGDGETFLIEVKGRIVGATDVVVTRTELLTAKNLGDAYRLALVQVSPDGPAHDQVRYLARPFDETSTDDFRQTKSVFSWGKLWAEGGQPR